MTAGQGRSSGTHLLLHQGLDHSPTMSTNSHAKNGISRRGLKQEAAEVAVGKNGATSVSSSSHWTLLVLFLSLLVDLIGFTVILPLIPSMLEYYSKNDQGTLYSSLIQKVDEFRDFVGAPDTEKFNIVLLGGLLGSLFSLLQFLASPIIGTSSDIFGRKAVLILSMVGVALSYAIWAISNNFMLFVVARVIGGLSKGNISVSTAVVADITTPEKRSRGMAAIGIAFSLGFLFGPSIGAAFSIWGRSSGDSSYAMFQYPALFSLLMALLNIIIMLVFFKDTLPVEKRASSLGHGLRGMLYLINPVSLFKFDAISKITPKDHSNIRLLGFTYFLYLFLFSGLEYSLTFLTHQRFHYTSMDQGKMFLYIGMIMILVQGGYLRRRPAGSEKRTALTGMLLIIPGMLLTGWASSTRMLYLGLAFYSFGAGTVVPSLSTITSKFGEGDEKGKVMGIFRSLGALARAFGPVTACTVYWRYSACVCYMVGACLFVVPILLLFLVNPAPGPETAQTKKQD